MCGFCCPVCGAPLQATEKCCVCPNGHSFDKAKNGYVNLLTHTTSGAKTHGDNKQMVRARRAFLEQGFYKPLCACIATTVKKYVVPGGVLLDSGCGEGYYTAAVCAALHGSMQVDGFDISKDAVRLAAARCPQAFFAVASAFRIPVSEHSVDMLLQIFSPHAAEEFQRVLKPGGIFIEVIPGARHLYALKTAVYDQPYLNDVQAFMRPGYQLLETQHLEDEIFLQSPQDIQNLFCMTPYYYKTGATEQARLASLSTLRTQTEFYVLAYRKL